VGRKNAKGNLQKTPLNLNTRFPSQRRLPGVYFKDAEMFYPSKSNSLLKELFFLACKGVLLIYFAY